jgi:hypothetical protein
MLNTGEIDKSHIDEWDILFLDVVKNFCRILKHGSPVRWFLIARH